MERRIVDGRDRRIRNLLYREFWNGGFQKLQGAQIASDTRNNLVVAEK